MIFFVVNFRGSFCFQWKSCYWSWGFADGTSFFKDVVNPSTTKSYYLQYTEICAFSLKSHWISNTHYKWFSFWKTGKWRKKKTGSYIFGLMFIAWATTSPELLIANYFCMTLYNKDMGFQDNCFRGKLLPILTLTLTLTEGNFPWEQLSGHQDMVTKVFFIFFKKTLTSQIRQIRQCSDKTSLKNYSFFLAPWKCSLHIVHIFKLNSSFLILMKG